jgi:hypothetical protein
VSALVALAVCVVVMPTLSAGSTGIPTKWAAPSSFFSVSSFGVVHCLMFGVFTRFAIIN